MNLNTDSSPFQSSPMDGTTSPRLFWQNRGMNNSENTPFGARSGSPSPTRRSSIERLQRASRVKNSNILALEHKQEYDPTRLPHIERPLSKVQGNAFDGTGIKGLRSEGRGIGHQRSESKTNIPLYSPTKMNIPDFASSTNAPRTPSKDQASPIKSSLSTARFKTSFDPETGAWSADTSCDERELPVGKTLHRHAKSVTFDAAPPQVNEYEMATPDLSSVGSNSREGSYESEEGDEEDEDHYELHDHTGHDDSFDASLEDTDKTPVVGPDDWRQSSHDDPYEHSPMPDEAPTPNRPQHNRTDSTNSNGDHRPLPPLPGAGQLTRSHSTSSTGLSATAERMLGAHRTLPSPPPASSTKSEIQNIGNGKMPLEERLKLMMLSDDGKTAAEQQRERRMRRAGTRERVGSQTPEREVQSQTAEEEEEGDDTVGDLSVLEDYQLPSRISRESILRRVNGNKAFERESDYNFSSPAPSSSPERPISYDPDVPIPSTEDSMLEDDEDNGSVIVTPQDDDDDDDDREVDVYSIPDLYQRSESQLSDNENDEANQVEDDAESHYSDNDLPKPRAESVEEDSLPTPRATTPVAEEPSASSSKETGISGALQLPSGNDESGFASSLESYMLPKPKEQETTKEPEGRTMVEAHAYLQRPYTPLSKPEYDGSGWGEPEDEYQEEPGTPDSVIHHPMDDYEEEEEQEEARDSPVIPERVATIKSASGSKLKTRPSATPSDIMSMREARRQVSREVPNVPPIPERHRNRMSRDLDELSTSDDFLERHPSFKKRSLTLDLDLGLSLDRDFDRVIEAQKVGFQRLTLQPQTDVTLPSPTMQESRQEGLATPATEALDADMISRKQRGYLMRQNTKLVAASDKDGDDFRGYRSAGNSPVKATRPQSWTVEPWNGQVRQSLRKRPGMPGPVPPLPGQESNAAPYNPLTEEASGAEVATEDSGERGRLFVKVMGVKDLDLPMPKSKWTPSLFPQCHSPPLTSLDERTWFSLTLDNGVHCVTTAWLELARNAPIGQEFELVVPNDLEFQLTLNVKLEKPAPKKVLQSPTKASKPKSVSTFSRVFASPRKRKEMDLRQREEEERLAQQQREAQARQMNAQPTAWDLLSPLVAEDGSFARAYVCLKEHETRCFGRPYLAEVAAFNEWATEEASFASSIMSKRGSTAVVRRAPYKIGKLELQLLFVPRPKGATDDDMPKSMNSCIREMKAAEERLARNWEGHLSQQGGDCPVSPTPRRWNYRENTNVNSVTYSTGAVATSSSLARSSRPTTRPLGNPAPPSISATPRD